MATRFYAALANTDNIAYFDEEGKRTRVSNTNVLPPIIRSSILLSLWYKAEIHYTTRDEPLDKTANPSFKPGDITHIFADCGAYNYRNENPVLRDKKTPLDSTIAWSRYQEEHFPPDTKIKQILLCAPDQILYEDHDEYEFERRRKYNLKQANEFLTSFPEQLDSDIVIPVGVIHGRNVMERKQHFDSLIDMGYRYVALGGMVPFASRRRRTTALDIVAGLDPDAENPAVCDDSILARCRRENLGLHIFGLNAPEWMRWWIRLGVDSYDGSKLSTEGAKNGTYWTPMDGEFGRPNYRNLKPTSANDMYERTLVGTFGIEDVPNFWTKDAGNYSVNSHPITPNGYSTACECDACNYFTKSRCTSPRCWGAKRWPDDDHVSDPRCMGSTEHNMGRMAHNAHIYEWMMLEMIKMNSEANEKFAKGELEGDSYLHNWRSI